MRKPVLFLMLIAFVMSCKTEPQKPTLPPDTYQVNISTKGVYNGLRAHINIMNDKRQEVPVDTAMIVDEKATFTGKITSPGLRTLTVNGVKGNLQFVLEPGITDIEVYKDSIPFSKVEGGKNTEIQNLYKSEYKKLSDAIGANRIEVSRARQQNDTARYGQLYQKSIQMAKELADFPYEFIQSHPDSDFSLLLLESKLIGQGQDLDKIKASMASLKPIIDSSERNKLIGQKLRTFIVQKEAQANLDVGKIAPNFSAPDPNGKVIALNDIKGKATIIDFWASWCGPCRRENPNVVKVYQKYHDKGLEIISVSLDKPNQQKRWTDAIKKDNLTWHHVSNLKYFNDPVARMYNINSIPSTFILDEEGRIVAKKLRGKALEDQIASMLN
ncbi:MAG: AhpC/TSA family protein [Bacteroidia bacterium]|nr:AhpC/TSA family protein [Bacteroidia bacterium]